MRRKDPTLEVRHVSKSFDGARAVDDASLDLRRGEIHALVGENGAGKSTLIKVISGVLRPDGGTILVDGVSVDFAGVRDAHRAGIATLHQELALVPALSVAENVLLGQPLPKNRLGLIRWAQVRRQARDLLAPLGVNPSMRLPAAQLSPAMQTMITIGRALALDARVVILDEPTASLTPQEIDHLFDVLGGLRKRGVSVLYVSHRLDEVFALCDRVTVMRDGAVVRTELVSELTVDDLIRSMVGRSPERLYPDRAESVGEVALATDRLSGRRVTHVSLEVHRGEVLGIAGLGGSGRSELLRLLGGAQRPRSGSIYLDGSSVRFASPKRALASGVVIVPEERRSLGLVMTQSVSENLTSSIVGELAWGGLVRRPSRERRRAEAIATSLRIRARGLDQGVGELSGGNQQKVLLGRSLSREPSVILMDEPTRGIDIGTKIEIYRLIREQAAGGAAVILVSSELPELIGLSDRIVVLRDGRVATVLDASATDEHEVLTHCYGRAA